MQFIDLAAQQKHIRKKIEQNILAVLDHGQYIMGPEIGLLEEKLAKYVGVNHAISCASGTDALLMALMAHDVGPGDAIFTSPFTFVATGEVISLLGATPIFLDIDAQTFNLDPLKLDSAIAAVKSGDSYLHPLPLSCNSLPLRPKGVIAVDLFGLPADYSQLNSLAQDHGIFVIEDAAQSFGAEYNGEKACALSTIGCTSFFPAKPLGCYGDGGMCFTDDGELYNIVDSLRTHGKGIDKYDNIRTGINGRMDTLQAAILLAKLEIFPEEVKRRQKVAERYNELLAGIESIRVPGVPESSTSVWAQYSIMASDENHRSRLQVKLKDEGIPTAIYYPKPLHRQTAYASLGYRDGDFPISEDCSRRIFSLPMHPYLAIEEQNKIAAILRIG
jgi:UDP-2-acetamido-2-deoxy-ribo-hexuluronate aminotransferase